MQIKIKLQAQPQCRVPICYQYAVQSMLYTLLQENPQYSAFLHDEGHGSYRLFKMFTFGRLTGRGYIRQKEIFFTENIFLEIRSCDIQFIETLLAALPTGKTLKIANAYATVLSAEVAEKTVDFDTLKISVPSGIAVYHTVGNQRSFINCTASEFPRMIQQNFAAKWQAFYGSQPTGNIALTPLKVDVEKDKIVTKIKGNYVTAWRGIYQLCGAKEHLQFLYDTGLGSKNAQGFGMFEILSE
ncbi:MAG: CRISPR-associated endoribonuclease Cas6 [Oscillospiraceae bacterium]